MIRHRRNNKVHDLFLNDGSWSNDSVALKEEANRYFQELFADDGMVRHTST